jgi:hypothetical protein
MDNMDFTIKNVSQLQQGLSKMKRPSEASLPNTPRSNTPTTPYLPDNHDHYVPDEGIPIDEYTTPAINHRPQSSAIRTGASQMSSSALLHNLGGLQTSTNKKLEILTDAVTRLHLSIEKMSRQQMKHEELLAAIVRNTANMKISIAEAQTPATNSKGTKVKGGSIKDYDFSTAKQLFAEFLIKLLDLIKVQVTSKGKQYTSMRDMDLKVASQIVSWCMDNEFRINGELSPKLDANSQKHPSLVKIASNIGTIEGTRPILTPESFRELLDDVECNYFMSCFQNILERARIIRLLVPFYEADIICSIQYPFFNKTGDVICDWHKIIPRNESPDESRAANGTTTERKKLAGFLAKGMSVRGALGAAMN